jgi:hypothetical protein
MYEKMGNQILPYTVIPNEMIADHNQEVSVSIRRIAAQSLVELTFYC